MTMLDTISIEGGKSAYLIIENEHGWTMEPIDWVPRWRRQPKRMKSFSRLSQLVWHLTRIHANDNSEALPLHEGSGE